jgi:hypothetical protein
VTVAGFAQNFATQTLTANNATFGQVTANQSITTPKLCVTKSNGTPVCVTDDQLAAVLSRRRLVAAQPYCGRK